MDGKTTKVKNETINVLPSVIEVVLVISDEGILIQV